MTIFNRHRRETSRVVQSKLFTLFFYSLKPFFCDRQVVIDGELAARIMICKKCGARKLIDIS